MTRNNTEVARAVRRALVTSAVAAAAASTLPAQAQEAADTQTVVVTGSRIQRQDYEASSPVVTVNTELLQRAGTVQIDTVLNTLPQLVPSVTTTTNNPSNGGQANIDLRGLGTQRTLVLLDGSRLVPSNTSGEIDLNTIPAALIENIELLTGGASSVYGSDAIAGVVNITLKKNFEGAQFTVQTGQTGESDGKTLAVDLLFGGNFADDRGNAVLALSYDDRDAVLQGDRAFSAVALGPDLTPQGSPTAPFGRFDRSLSNLPDQAVVDQVFARYGVAPGAVSATNFLGFNPDHTLFDISGAENFKGDTSDPGFNPASVNYNFAPVNYLQLPLTRRQIAGFGNFQLSESAESYARLIYTTYNADTQLAATPITGVSIPVTNPNIPTDLAEILASRPDPDEPFTFRTRPLEVGPRISQNQYDVVQGLIGFKGDFPAFGGKTWSWDIYGSWGQMKNTELQAGNLSFSRFEGLLNDPSLQIGDCTGTTFNVFGEGSITPECAAAISIRTTNVTQITQDNFVGSITGPLFDMPAGPFQMAIGAEYRNTRASFRPDEFLQSGDVVGFNAQPAVDGRIDVKEGFVEFAVPLLKDKPAVAALDLELGYRHSDYNLAGTADTYKAGLNWQATDALKFRASFNHAIRAPSVFELFLPPQQNFPGYVDPCNAPAAGQPDTRSAEVLALCAQQIPNFAAVQNVFEQSAPQAEAFESGNLNLNPESADTYTIGAVWQGEIGSAQRLRASLDYWNYDVSDTIGQVSAGSIVNRCFNDAGANPTYDPANPWCARFHRNAAGDIEGILQPFDNLGELKVKGIDAQIDFGTPLGDRYGNLTVNLLVTRLLSWDFAEDNLSPFGHFEGTISTGLAETYPEWKAVTNLGWHFGQFSVDWNIRYIDGMRVVNNDALGSPVQDGLITSIGSYAYHRLTGTWSPTDAFHVTLGVDNLFDKDPPIYTDDAQAGVQANTEPGTYDVLGRRFFLVGQYKF
ncbi:MAG: TonB-dependent receptor [Steroidobacteraceae bacterium]|nr:TonB-dependent receptor [Steroidobacteraceae bacterium]